MSAPHRADRAISPGRLSGIYAILDAGTQADLETTARACLQAGIGIFQYRAKAGFDAALLERLQALIRPAGALLIVNDRLAAAALADGVHLGQEDLLACDAGALRTQLAGKILGISCGTPQEARAAAALGADYLGVGPFAATATKHDAGPPLGQAGLREVVAASSVPVAAIGGITLADLPAVAAAGARMAAVVSALHQGTGVARSARALVAAWAAAVSP